MDSLTITIPDAQRATGLGKTKIYDLIAKGKLSSVKVGRRTLVKTESVRALVGQTS